MQSFTHIYQERRKVEGSTQFRKLGRKKSNPKGQEVRNKKIIKIREDSMKFRQYMNTKED